MDRGTGPTANKFRKIIGTRCLILEVGLAPHQYTIERLKAGERTDGFTKADVAEIVALYEPKEVPDAPAPDAKRGPGRPRKVDREAGPTREIYQEGA